MSLDHLIDSEATWRQWQMPNGLRCIHIPLPKGDQRFQITTLIGTGSRHEPGHLAGISHLLEHMMFRGSKRYPSFADLSVAFESLGGEWNAATGHEYTEFYYNGTADNLSESISLFADFMIRPELSDLETERRIVQRELEGELNENGISTDPDYHIATKIFPGQPMAMPIIGTADTLKNISEEDLRSWFKSRYIPEDSVICVVGGSSDTVKQTIEQHFIEWKPAVAPINKPKIASSFKGPHAFWVENSDNEYQVQLSFLCEGTGSSKTAAYELLSRILSDGFSSRLTRRIREELGLVYDISSSLHQYDGYGLMNINASVLGENLKSLFKEVFTVLDSLKSGSVTGDELSRHKRRARVDLDITTAEPSALAWRASWALLSATELNLSHWAKNYERLSADDLTETAREIFRPENLCVVALGPKEGDVAGDLVKITHRWHGH